MDWNAALYRKSHGFVAEYGKNLLACVPEDAAQCILDFGCGTGELTAALAGKAGQVVGVDQSAAMIRAARETYPVRNTMFWMRPDWPPKAGRPVSIWSFPMRSFTGFRIRKRCCAPCMRF